VKGDHNNILLPISCQNVLFNHITTIYIDRGSLANALALGIDVTRATL